MTIAYGKPLPLSMGEKLIGQISFDENGKIEGQLIGTELVDLLNEFFEGGLLDVAFRGVPGNRTPEVNQELVAKMRQFTKSGS